MRVRPSGLGAGVLQEEKRTAKSRRISTIGFGWWNMGKEGCQVSGFRYREKSGIMKSQGDYFYAVVTNRIDQPMFAGYTVAPVAAELVF